MQENQNRDANFNKKPAQSQSGGDFRSNQFSKGKMEQKDSQKVSSPRNSEIDSDRQDEDLDVKSEDKEIDDEKTTLEDSGIQENTRSDKDQDRRKTA